MCTREMLKLLILALVAGAITAATDSEWTVYKATHGKVYDGKLDFVRRAVWESNLEKIKNHNELYAKGLKSFYLGDNEHADMTTEEFVKTMNGYKPLVKTRSQKTHVPEPVMHLNTSLPLYVNWVNKGYVTQVKNQLHCGSCWAFSATGSLEGAHFKKTGQMVSLSEKNLMDCSRSYGNNGCEGGLMDLAFRYVIDNKGIDTERSYPYQPVDGPCRFQRSNVGATAYSFKDITPGSEKALQYATATIGPVSVALDASHFSFQLYRGGLYDEPACSSYQLDHGVLVVGYGSEHGKDYWLVKNSWGTGWGMDGYIKMSRNKNNQCGIASVASYPIV